MNSFQPLPVQVALSHALAPPWNRSSMPSHLGKRVVLVENSSIEPKILGYLRASAGAAPSSMTSTLAAAMIRPSQCAAEYLASPVFHARRPGALTVARIPAKLCVYG